MDFALRAKKDKDFAGSVGLYCPKQNIAYIDKSLPKTNEGSRSLCINHEITHSRTASLDLNKLFSEKIEEEIVELEAITRTESKALSFAELMFKRLLTNGNKLNPKKMIDRERILKNIFRVIGIRVNKKTIRMIATGKKQESK